MAKNKIKDDFSEDDEIGSREFWNYEEDKKLLGKFVSFESDKYGEHAIINNGEENIHLPNLMTLNSKLKNAEEGDKVKIVYQGEKKAEETGRSYKDFKVFIK